MQRGLAPVFIVLGLGVLFLVAVGAYYIYGAYETNDWKIVGDYFPEDQKACTLEAMICPDGSSVGRTGPNCEFTPCLSVKPSAAASGSAETANWKTYQDNNFTFKYPSDWKAEDPKVYGEYVMLTYMADDVQYHFAVSSGGRGGPTADKVEESKMTVDNKEFGRRIWINNEKPFFISVYVLPNTGTMINHFEMNLPPKDSDKFLQTFDQILATFKFN